MALGQRVKKLTGINATLFIPSSMYVVEDKKKPT